MVIRRLVALAVAVALSGTFAAAQSAKPDKKKRSKQEQAEIELIVKTIDGAMAGQPTPNDIEMKITPYFLKSQEPRTFVPFVLETKGAPAADAAMYIRVVSPDFKPDPKAKKVEYPWDDIHFIPAATVAAGPLQRVFMATPGTYDVYIAMKERLPEKAPKTAVASMGVLKTQIVVPDFMNVELSTSSVLVTDKVEYVDYKDVNLLQRFMSDRSKLRARRMNGNTVQQQRDVALAVKNAREMALLPYTKRVASARAPRRGEEDGSYNDRPRRSRDKDSNESLADTYKDVIEAAVEAPLGDDLAFDDAATEEA